MYWQLGSSRHDIKEEIKPEATERISTTPREMSTGLDDFLNDDDAEDEEEDDSDEYTDGSEDDEEDDDDDDDDE